MARSRWIWLAAAVALAAATTGSAGAQAPAQPAPSDALKALVQAAQQAITAQQWDAARQALERAAARAASEGNAIVEAGLERRLGSVFQSLKNVPSAREHLQRALALYESAGNRPGMGDVENDLGLLAWREANWPAVRAHFAAAAEHFGAAGDRVQQATTLRNLTFARDLTHAERETVLARAYGLVEGIDKRQEGLILHQWGDARNFAGDYAGAIEKLEPAVALLEEAGQPTEFAGALTSLGRTYRLHGLPDRALATYQQALALQQKAGDSRGVAQTLDAMAVAYNAGDRRREAAAADERALAIATELGESFLTRSIRLNLAGIYLDSREYARSASLLERALESVDDAFARSNLALAYVGLGRLGDAEREADRAVALQNTQADQPFRTLTNRARVRLALGNAKGALEDTRVALARMEELRTKIVPRDFMKQGFGEQHRALFALAVDLLDRIGDTAGALEMAERARGRAFLDLLATRDVSGPAPLVARGGGPPDLPSRVSAEAPSLQELSALASRLETSIVLYWVSEDTTFIWVVKADGSVASRRVTVEAARYGELARAVWTAPAPEERRRDAGPTRGALITRGGERVTLVHDPSASLRRLYDLLIEPIRPLLPQRPGARLTIIPHGPLFQVSFAALTDKRGRYLIESVRLHYAPSAGVLRFTSRIPSRVSASYLFVADPDPPPTVPGEGLAPLPGARREVRTIADLLPRGSTTTLIGREATEEEVLAAVADRSVLHLATHGVVADMRPLESFLALARSGGDAANDGRLAMGEIYGLRLSASLVVLSACRSATGKVTGDGIAGLTRAFLYAGASSIVATLWDLADEPARHLLPDFYRAWLKDGDKSGALRDAQLRLIRALRRGEVRVATPLGVVTLPEHPALWAGVVLIGEP